MDQGLEVQKQRAREKEKERERERERERAKERELVIQLSTKQKFLRKIFSGFLFCYNRESGMCDT